MLSECREVNFSDVVDKTSADEGGEVEFGFCDIERDFDIRGVGEVREREFGVVNYNDTVVLDTDVFVSGEFVGGGGTVVLPLRREYSDKRVAYGLPPCVIEYAYDKLPDGILVVSGVESVSRAQGVLLRQELRRGYSDSGDVLGESLMVNGKLRVSRVFSDNILYEGVGVMTVVETRFDGDGSKQMDVVYEKRVGDNVWTRYVTRYSDGVDLAQEMFSSLEGLPILSGVAQLQKYAVSPRLDKVVFD